MNYNGPLFGKIGKKYVELDVTTEFTDRLVARIKELETERNKLSESETKLAEECVQKSKRIAKLEAESKRLLTFANTEVLAISQSEKILALELENERLRDLVGKAFESGWDEFCPNARMTDKLTEFLRAKGLGEG